MTKCLRPDCPNEVVQTSKKPKKYCSSNCKQIVWQRSRKGKDGTGNASNKIVGDVKNLFNIRCKIDTEGNSFIEKNGEWVPRPKNGEILPIFLSDYKEGGLYMFENGVFTLMDEYVKSVGETKRIALDSHPLPLNKEDEKQSFVKFSDIKNIPDNVKKAIGYVGENIVPKVVASIEGKIKEIEAEKIPKDRDTPLGRKSWAKEQQKRIVELKNKLK